MTSQQQLLDLGHWSNNLIGLKIKKESNI